jgi:hypothetical protein
VITQVPARRPRLRLLGSGLACVGIALLVIGTFLPWLVSGRVNRNSYSASGALRTLLDLGGAVGAALRIWPFVSLVGAVAVALIVLGYAGIGSGLALLTAIVAGTVAVAALTTSNHGLIHVAAAGPAVTLTGSALTLIGALAYFAHILFASRRQA